MLSKWEELNPACKTKDERKFWSLISLKDAKCTYITPPISPDNWCSYFENIFDSTITIGTCASNVPHNFIDMLPKGPPISELEVKVIITTLAAEKAPGIDLLPPEVYKNNSEWWAPILAKLFTYINDTGIFPDSWKQSIIFPIHKKGDATNPQNYCPISLLDISLKIYTQLLLDKLSSWAEDNNIIAQDLGKVSAQQTKSSF